MKIAYIMLVDWRWIKQRPHFLAEELAKEHDVTVIYQFRYGIKGKQKNKTENLKLKPMYVVPRGDRIPVLRRINKRIKKWIIDRYVKKEQPECIYATYPNQVELIPDGYTGRIIYDCMDDHSAFLSDQQEKQALEKQEKELLERANHVLVSSEKLREVLQKRYDCVDKVRMTIVRNAFNGHVLEYRGEAEKSTCSQQRPFTIAYFGTISKWFDFELLQKSIADFPDIQYILMGPVAGVTIPNSPNIVYRGTVEHDALYDAVSDVDCLIMPFVVNEIIESVDPVKLYEYINFQKNILCIEYQEVKRFDPFVYFYSDYETYMQKITCLMRCNMRKYTEEQRINFLHSNDWASRVAEINLLLEN